MRNQTVYALISWSKTKHVDPELIHHAQAERSDSKIQRPQKEKDQSLPRHEYDFFCFA